jgi:hypothetical protein
MERSITTISLFKSQRVVAGSSGISDPIDLRDISKNGDFSVYYKIDKAGGVATCGSAKLSFTGSPVYDGTYISPTNGTFGTVGDGGGNDIVEITPPVMPFMKINIAIGTSGTALVTASLHVR